eukprot:3940880-Rhodomonas_salina.6
MAKTDPSGLGMRPGPYPPPGVMADSHIAGASLLARTETGLGPGRPPQGSEAETCTGSPCQWNAGGQIRADPFFIRVLIYNG